MSDASGGRHVHSRRPVNDGALNTMATFVCYEPGDSRELDLYDFIKGSPVFFNQSSTSFIVAYGGNKVTVFTGVGYVYDPATGAPIDGTTTSGLRIVDGKPFGLISDTSISTPQAGAYISWNDPQAVNADVFKGNDTITGSAYDDYLDGYGGADTIYGGKGNDTFIISQVGDKAYEAVGEGTKDLVLASVAYSLAGQDIENLTLTGTSNIAATGNALANTLTGNAGDNVLNGVSGKDRMVGGAGNDTYVTDGGDTIVEAAAAGTDLVKSSVTLTLGANLENLTLTGTTSINGTGNTLANTLTGNGAANLLDGKTGADILQGGAGADTFVFSTALSASNLDHIKDFVVGTDLIQLSSSIFKALTADATTHGLTATEFKDVTAPSTTLDADDHILYNHTTGALSYDADGSGAIKAVQFAVLDTHPAVLTAGAFLLA